MAQLAQELRFGVSSVSQARIGAVPTLGPAGSGLGAPVEQSMALDRRAVAWHFKLTLTCILHGLDILRFARRILRDDLKSECYLDLTCMDHE